MERSRRKEMKDINWLYAAKNFAKYITIKQPEQPKGAKAIKELYEILEPVAKEAASRLSSLDESIMDEETDTMPPEMDAIISEAYHKIKSEASRRYGQYQATKTLTKDEEAEFNKFIQEFAKEDLYGWISGAGEELATEPNPQLTSAREEDERKHTQYLASAGINTPEGQAAWYVAHFAGLHFSRIFSYMASSVMFVNEVKATKDEFNMYLDIAMAEGFECARETAIIADQDNCREAAKQWLRLEIEDRLSKGLEFNLLEKVSIRQDKDGFIYLRSEEKPGLY